MGDVGELRVQARLVLVPALADAAEVEQLLARLRAANVRVEDLEIGRADLEDVFIEIMQGGGSLASQEAA